MKKAIFVIMVYCLAASTAFAQFTYEIQLSEDKPKDEFPVIINDYEHGRVYIKKIGEPNDQGYMAIQIELENKSYDYYFLLFDHDWKKKELRKYHIVLDKLYVGENSKGVDGIKLLNGGYINTVEMYDNYTFPEIRIKEKERMTCTIPIHLAKSTPGLFWADKKKMFTFISYTISISVDGRDTTYEKLKTECDSLFVAFGDALEREDFCTNSLHPDSFEKQTVKYTTARDGLRKKISNTLNAKGWSKESKKYEQYQKLLESLDMMDKELADYNSEKHDCGKHQPKKQINCSYCKLTLEQIYKELDRYYKLLYAKKVKKSEIWNRVQALYICGTTHKHARKSEDSSYRESIIQTYKMIKESKNGHE